MNQTNTPQIIPNQTADNDEVAVAAARLCFRWDNPAIDDEGDLLPAEYDDEGEWVQTSDEVDICLAAFDDGRNETGLPPKLITTLTGVWNNGNETEIEVELRQVGFRRDGDLPVATYWARRID